MVFIITKLSTYLHDTKHLYSLEMYVGTVQYHSRGEKITLVTLFGLHWLRSFIQYENCVYHLENFFVWNWTMGRQLQTPEKNRTANL